MQRKTVFTVLALAAATAAGLSTVAFAERGPRGHGMHGDAGGMQMFNFEQLDTDKDGKITEAEIGAQRLARVTAADANADGLLNAEELAAMQLAEMTARATERAARMIERFDADADGQLSAAELAAGPQPTSMFDRIDADADGAITQAEVDAAREKMGEHRKRRGGRD